MSQQNPVIASGKTGTQYRTEDNDGKTALLNFHKGSTAPSYAGAGMMWCDDSSNPVWTYKKYDGSDWITVGTLNTTTNVWLPAGIPGATVGEVRSGTATDKYVTPDSLAMLWEKGSDIASASTLTIPSGGGSYFQVTGTTAITALSEASSKAGRLVRLTFTAALTLTHNGTSLILPGASNITTAAGDHAVFILEDAGANNWRCVAYQRASGLLGVNIFTNCPTTANNTTDPTNDIDFGAGAVWSDDGLTLMRTTGTIVKRLDANWVVGTNQGGLDTGAKANSTTYHLWMIHRTDTGVTDFLFSTSATAPTMPANYNRKRCIGAVITDGTGTIRAYIQYGSMFFLSSPPLDVNATLGTTRTNYTLTTPSGVATVALIQALAVFTAGGIVYISPIAATDLAASTTAAPLGILACGASNDFGTAQMEVLTNTSSQISARSNAASTTFRVATIGWIDQRGRE